MNRSHLLLISIFSIIATGGIGQDNMNDTQLFKELKDRDSLLFNLGYKNCDTIQLRDLLSSDFEFYHDQNGFLDSKELFIHNAPNLCNMDYKPIRALIDSSLTVFPLYANGDLYGAIQKGIHEFYAIEENKPRYLTSTARFTHVWIIEDDEWKLKRVLSYNHVAPQD